MSKLIVKVAILSQHFLIMEEFIVLGCGFLLTQEKKEIRSPARRFWENSLAKRRKSYGLGGLLEDIKKNDIGLNGELRSMFHGFLRMTSTEFENLVQLIGPKIAKQNTILRAAIPVTERLAVTLRFLATGDSFSSLFFLSGISKASLSDIIPTTCEALLDSLQCYIKVRLVKLFHSVKIDLNF